MDAADRAARVVRSIVEAVKPGFAVELWNGERIGPSSGPALRINDSAALGRLVRWPRLTTLVELWAAKALDVEGGSLFDIVALRPEGKLKAKLRSLPKLQLLRDLPALAFGANSKAAKLGGRNPFVSGSDKEAIEYHYDISNEFYQLFLDERMVYTCAYFTDFTNSIDQAQADKLEHICRKLRLKPGDTLLDIGCGWGSLLIYAAKNHGAIGHGVSLSERQTSLARERIRAEGLEDRVRIDVMSYTELDGTYDKIASIGMFEAVGLANHRLYFETVHRLLKPDGIYLHHSITRRQRHTLRQTLRKGQENRALVKYIFPGGEVDAIGMTAGSLEACGFEVHDVENLRRHYARTCRLWAERLRARFDEAIALVGEAKARLWLLYLTGCSISFERSALQIFQTVATKRTRGMGPLPPTREDIYRKRV